MKQVIAVRKDLKMPLGKACTQAAHASVEAVLNSSRDKVEAWRSEGAKKVVVKVNSEKELLELQRTAKSLKLVASLITDAGKTFFKQPTITCLGIGPDDDEKIDKVTGSLKMF